jgi:ketosteroid isomerase-like protein
MRGVQEDVMQMETAATPDLSVIANLNREYIDAVKRSDVGWFDAMLVPDFRCSLPDGSLIDRGRFLERSARPLDVSDLEIHDVEVRVLGDTAIVHARTTFSTSDGRSGSGRYTDVWCRQDGRWLAAAAHFTRQVA